MKTIQQCLLSVIIVIGSSACAWSAEIPATLDPAGSDRGQAVQLLGQAGLPHDEAVTRADSLDRVELAQLSRSDLEQKGGIDPLSFTLVVVGVVILGLMWIFTVCEP